MEEARQVFRIFHSAHLDPSRNGQQTQPGFGTQFPQVSSQYPTYFYVYPYGQTPIFVSPTDSGNSDPTKTEFPSFVPREEYPTAQIPTIPADPVRPSQPRYIPPYIPPRTEPPLNYVPPGFSPNGGRIPRVPVPKDVATEQDDMNGEPEEGNGYDGNRVNKEIEYVNNYF